MAIEKKSEGFGSDIAKVAKFIHADQAALRIARALGYEDCGCGPREEALNDPNLLINKVFYKNKEQDEDIKE